VFELRPCTLARMFSSISELTGPNIDFLGPQQRTLNPQKNTEIRFFAKMAEKTTPGSGFRPKCGSPPSTRSF